MKKAFLIIFVISIIGGLLSCGGREQNRVEAGRLHGTISLSGAFALYPIVNVWAEEFSKLHPDVRFNVSAGGAGKGMSDVLSGAVDLGMFSREIKEEEIQKGVWWLSVTKDAVLPTVSGANPVADELRKKGLTREQFASIFSGIGLEWGALAGNGNKDKVNPYTRSDASGAADVWAKYVGANGQEALQGLGVFGDPGLAEALKKDRFGIGYNNVIYVYDLRTKQKYPGLEVVPIDINENGIIDEDENFYQNIDSITDAIANGKYPSPPARELYLLSKGKPTDPVVLAFLEWVLQQGQAYVDQAGYIALKQDLIDSELNKLK